MHILIAGLYGCILTFAAILYAMIAEPDHALAIALCGPFILSGFVIALSAMDWGIHAARRRWL